MSDDLIQRRERRHPMELQLTAMIDVFSIIVIFLILGTVFGASEMVIPNDVKLPFSDSKEGVENALRVAVHNGEVSGNFFPDRIQISEFQRQEDSPEMKALQEKLKKHADDALKGAELKMLNTIADRDTPYGQIFDVIRVFRLAGFRSILFVAEGDAGANRSARKGLQ